MRNVFPWSMRVRDIDEAMEGVEDVDIVQVVNVVNDGSGEDR